MMSIAASEPRSIHVTAVRLTGVAVVSGPVTAPIMVERPASDLRERAAERIMNGPAPDC